MAGELVDDSVRHGLSRLPTLLAVALGAIVWRFRKARRPALYGRSAWAGDAAMRAGGVRQSRTLPR